MKTNARIVRTATLILGSLTSTQALAYGALVTPEGQTASIVRARVLIVREAESTRIIAQIKTSGTATRFGWLLPVPNVNLPAENGVLVTPFDKAALDELEALTAPRFEGACEGVATGEVHDAYFAESFKAGQAGNPNATIKSAPEVQEGDLNQYLIAMGRDYQVTEDVQSAITDMVDQNLMFVVVNVDTTMAPPGGVDPIISVQLPIAIADDFRLGLSPSLATLGGDRVDLLVWTLSDGRSQSNLPTRELDAAASMPPVQFVSNTETTYDSVFETFVDTGLMSRAFVAEYARGVDSFDHDALGDLVVDSGATHLTRLRASFKTAALSGTKIASIRRSAEQGEYDRVHAISGRACGAVELDMGGVVMMPDLGVGDGALPDMSGSQPPLTDDMGPSNDGGLGDGSVVSGGDDGNAGCTFSGSKARSVGAATLFLLLLTTLGLRRRRA